MRKKISWLSFLTVLSLSVISCRTSDDYLSSQEETYSSNKFQIFTSHDGKPVNYGDGFKFLLERHDSLNNIKF